MEFTPSAIVAYSPMATGLTSSSNVTSASIAGQSGQLLVGYGTTQGGIGDFNSAVTPFQGITFANGVEYIIF